MKRTLFLLLISFFAIDFIVAQPHYQENRRPDFSHQQKIFATTEDGLRVVLFPNGSWKIAHHQPQRFRYTSQLRGNYLSMYLNNQEIAKVRVVKSSTYEFDCRCYRSAVSFGATTYAYNDKDQIILLNGDIDVGKSGTFEDAIRTAAFDFTENVFNGITSDLKGSYLYVYENGVELNKLFIRVNSRYDFKTRSYHASISIGNATYEYQENTRLIKFLGKNVVGKAYSVDVAKRIAAGDYLNRYYGNERY